MPGLFYRPYRYLCLAFSLFILASCLPESVTEPFKNRTAVTEQLEKELNIDVEIGFHIKNGSYTSYSIVVMENANSVSADTVAKHARPIIKNIYATPPAKFTVSFAYDTKEPQGETKE